MAIPMRLGTTQMLGGQTVSPIANQQRIGLPGPNIGAPMPMQATRAPTTSNMVTAGRYGNLGTSQQATFNPNSVGARIGPVNPITDNPAIDNPQGAQYNAQQALQQWQQARPNAISNINMMLGGNFTPEQLYQMTTPSVVTGGVGITGVNQQGQTLDQSGNVVTNTGLRDYNQVQNIAGLPQNRVAQGLPQQTSTPAMTGGIGAPNLTPQTGGATPQYGLLGYENALQQSLGQGLGFLQGGLSAGLGSLDATNAAVQQQIGNAVQMLSGTGQQGVNAIQGGVNAGLGQLANTMTGAGNVLQNAQAGALGSLAQGAQGATGQLQGSQQGALQALSNAMQGASGFVGSGTQSALNQLAQAGQLGGAAINQGANQALGQLNLAGRQGVGAIQGGVGAGLGMLGQAGQQGAQSLTGALNQAQGAFNQAAQQGRADISGSTNQALGQLQSGLGSALGLLSGQGPQAVASRASAVTVDPNTGQPLFREAAQGIGQFAGAGLQAQQNQLALSGALGQEAFNNALMNNPATQFLREQGQEAIINQQAALGGLGGGNVMRELSRFNQGLAAQDLDAQFNRLGQLTGQGMQAAGQSGQFLAQAGQQMGNLASTNAQLGTQANLANASNALQASLANAQMGNQRALTGAG